MEHQTQITDESNHDHSSVHSTHITIRPTAAAASLVHAEYSRGHGDFVITIHEQPEVIEMVAKMVEADPILVSVHMAVTHGMLSQAVYVDGKIRLGNASTVALSRINLSGIDFGQSILLKRGRH